MTWKRMRHIFTASGENEFHRTHAQIPTPLHLQGGTYRIFYSARDTHGLTRPFYLDYDFDRNRIVKTVTTPLFDHGPAGSFDDSGIMPSCAVRVGADIYLYYIAWNRRVSVPYHLSIGLAISRDGGESFRKAAAGPIMDRCADEPFFNTAPCVLPENGAYRMWYISTVEWRRVQERLEPVYLVRHARSSDGIAWTRDPGFVIPAQFDGEAIGRPWVITDQRQGHEMWYSRRGSVDYRLPDGQHYTIGYAESTDGTVWNRRDELAGPGEAASGWDSDMTEYCSVIDLGTRRIMLYNGNGFGESGFGYAELEMP